MARQLDVDPQTLLASTQRLAGADGVKLHRQIIRFGTSVAVMPSIAVEEDPDGQFRILNGMTRATRVAMLLRGTTVRIDVQQVVRQSIHHTNHSR